MSAAILLENGRWFINLRWFAVAIFIIIGACARYVPALFNVIGLSPSAAVFNATALFLFITNALFFSAYGFLKSHDSKIKAYQLIYGQIFLDLVAITYVVHHVGSTDTPVAFLYTLHIALACVFFDAFSSFLVTLIASLLFLSCTIFEQQGIVPVKTIFTDAQPNTSIIQNYLSTLATITFFISLWYVVSRLSRMIRKREAELMDTQKKLISAHKEKEEYAKHTTHQLKSPLDCMRSNLALVLEGYVGEVDGPAAEMLKKVENKAAELGQTIMEVLQLSRLKTDTLLDNKFVEVELHTILKKCIHDVEASASKRGITINDKIGECSIMANVPQLQLLLNNLLSNAINYSNTDSQIDVFTEMVQENAKPYAHIQIRDYGIGINEEKIPYIFDEYFKTPEAVKHNAASSGIGLAIVRKVAELHKVEITVESEVQQGTCFDLRIPAR
jgi:signal transduction histidine kinase